jgi:pimeloyl-ACP methyl ester carboxylesterase
MPAIDHQLEGEMPTLENGPVTIYYEEVGSGFPVLLFGPGGLDSSIDTWPRAAINPLVTLGDDFRLIAMDQRNAGASTGPVDLREPWESYADDQLALVDHLGLDSFHVLGCCIGCSFALKLIERAPDRIASAVLEQPNGLTPENRESQLNYHQNWAGRLVEAREDVTKSDVDRFLEVMWSGDFVVSVTRDFVASISTPMLVLPGIDLGHPTALGREIGSLAKNAETYEPWKDTPEDVVRGTEVVREFLRAHTPA